MTVTMSDFGQSLTTRAAGRAAYDHIAGPVSRVSQGGQTVVFDFDGVRTITNSFADEVFRRLVAGMGFDEFRRRTTFRNIHGLWARVVRSAMDSRTAQTV